MTHLEATWIIGQIIPDQPVAWPDGLRLRLEPILPELTGMTEEEQGDDPASIAKWVAEWQAIPPLTMSAEDEAAWLEWERKTREFNLEAARREMFGDDK